MVQEIYEGTFVFYLFILGGFKSAEFFAETLLKLVQLGSRFWLLQELIMYSRLERILEDWRELWYTSLEGGGLLKPQTRFLEVSCWSTMHNQT